MVHNCYIKCQVCGCITRVRLQVGWQESHPIVVTCGECRTSLFGRVKIGQDTLGLEYHLIMLIFAMKKTKKNTLWNALESSLSLSRGRWLKMRDTCLLHLFELRR